MSIFAFDTCFGAVSVAAGRQAAGGGQVDVRMPDLQPRAAALLKLAVELTPVAAVTPMYLRQPDAKPQTPGTLVRG